MAVLAALFLAFIPALFYAWMTYWMDRYEKEPLHLLGGAFIWGAVVAAGGAFVLNTLFGIAVYTFTADEALTDIATGSISAPLVEEALKSFAVLLVFLIFRKEFDSILDGIVYAAITALGFAATENVLYMVQFGYAEGGWEGLWFIWFLRVVLGAWGHATYTAFFGIGLAIARNHRSAAMRVIAPLAGFGMAVFVHFLHNTVAVVAQGEGGILLLFAVDWLGWLVIFGVMLWAIRRERDWIRHHLQSEVESGLISEAQYRTACSAFQRGLTQIGTLGSGKYRTTQRFYARLADLAYKKQQIARRGENSGNTMAMVTALRAEIQALAAKAAA